MHLPGSMLAYPASSRGTDGAPIDAVQVEAVKCCADLVDVAFTPAVGLAMRLARDGALVPECDAVVAGDEVLHAGVVAHDHRHAAGHGFLHGKVSARFCSGRLDGDVDFSQEWSHELVGCTKNLDDAFGIDVVVCHPLFDIQHTVLVEGKRRLQCALESRRDLGPW